MSIFPGHIVTAQGCDGSCTRTVTKPVDDVDMCISACLNAGYGICKSIQFKPAGAFGLAENECTMFSTGMKSMGAHATAEVLATGGLGAVVADFCEPPSAFASFPLNAVPDYGVDWETACAGKEMAVVPGAEQLSTFLPIAFRACNCCSLLSATLYRRCTPDTCVQACRWAVAHVHSSQKTWQTVSPMDWTSTTLSAISLMPAHLCDMTWASAQGLECMSVCYGLYPSSWCIAHACRLFCMHKVSPPCACGLLRRCLPPVCACALPRVVFVAVAAAVGCSRAVWLFLSP